MEKLVEFYEKYIQANTDKVLHLTVSFMLGHIFGAGIFAVVFVVALAYLKEYVDKKYRNGVSDFYDIVASIVGVLLSLVF